MVDQLDDSAPFDDDQGTRISTPTGAGAEATEGTEGKPKGSSHEHQSGYGGKGGVPNKPNDTKDIPTSRR